ncbi:MAG: hypothetical protein J5614_02125 [Paludibacteraceae bacterium]|nr:hypothetical protein [Paludibacteraceae bacterium]
MGNRNNPNLLAYIRQAVANREHPQHIRVYGQNQINKVINGEPIDDLKDTRKQFKEENNNG